MKRYRGDRHADPPVVVETPRDVPRPLLVVPYPYERDGAPPLGWGRGHDGDIRLAASLLADVFGPALAPYEHEVPYTPQHLVALGLPVEPTRTYIARALAEELIGGLGETFELSEAQIRAWAAAKGLSV